MAYATLTIKGISMKIRSALTIHCVCAKLRKWEEQQACWESQKDELEQRVEYGAERVDKLEK